jgi:AmmeMemoRadiSam system protein A
MSQESIPVALARQSLEHYLTRRETLAAPDELPTELRQQAGVFVSLKKKGQLRGCIGTFAPTQPTIGEEIIRNAVSAGTEDPRFWPVKAEELSELTISVDILSAPEPVSGPAELDERRYGIIVRRGRRSGLLLPDLEGVDSVAEQIAIARQKAGIAPEEDVELYRFQVTRYT